LSSVSGRSNKVGEWPATENACKATDPSEHVAGLGPESARAAPAAEGASQSAAATALQQDHYHEKEAHEYDYQSQKQLGPRHFRKQHQSSPGTRGTGS
jgi:hypothetical protein